jgi:hypothetical protein
MNSPTSSIHPSRATLQETPLVFLCVAGRAGGGLLQSLLDNHPQILMLPIELKFLKLWRLLNAGSIGDPMEMASLWCRRSAISRFSSGIHYGFEDSSNSYSPCDLATYQQHLSRRIAEYGLDRTGVFLAIHHAYADTLLMGPDQIRIIVEFTAYAEELPEYRHVFPGGRVLQVVRDHRATYMSTRKQDRLYGTLRQMWDGLRALNKAQEALGPRSF